MAGLLDAFNDPEFQRGLLMMAASRPMSEQARAGLLSYVDNQEEAKLKRQYMGLQMEGQKAQTDANRSKLALAQEQAEFDRKLFGGLMGSGAGAGQPQVASASPGAPTQGAAPSSQSGAGFIAGLSPDQLAALKIRGHDLTGIWEQTRPDMQVTNGYAYDKRNLGAGFMPGLQTTADGKSTMTRIGQDGMPVVSAPAGALKTYQDYKESDANIAARNKLMKRYNPETGQEEWVTEAQALGAAGGRPAPTPRPLLPGAGSYGTEAGLRGNMQGGMGANPQDIDRELVAIQRDLQNPTLDAQSRQLLAQQAQTLMAQRGRLPSGGGGQTAGPMAAGPSASQAAEQKANEVRLIDEAKAGVVKDTKRGEATQRSGQLTSVMDEAISILKQGPTASLAGAGVDKVTNALGVNTKGAELAQRLEALAGWAVSNVPRMEGPQSDRDVINYANMAGRVGDRTVPIQQRIAAAEQVKALQEKYSHLNGAGATAQSTQSTQKPAGKAFSDYGYSSAQDMIQDAQNAIMRNPGARSEVNRRLKEAGLSLNTGAW